MKIGNFFIHIFSVLVYLTIGSLLVIMALQIVDMQSVVASVEDVYSNFWGKLQALILGFLFICVGLAFARILVKKARTEDALVYRSRRGLVSVSLVAIEDIARKAIKKFLVVKECKVKTYLEDTKLEVLLRLTLWSSMNIPDVLREVQEEVRQRLVRVLGQEYPFEIKAEVVKVEEHHSEQDMNAAASHAVSS